MKRFLFAVCVGAAASLGGFLVGVSQPGRSIADLLGKPAHGYDVFILDHYFIVRPAILMANLVAFAIVAYVVMTLWRRWTRGGGGAVGTTRVDAR